MQTRAIVSDQNHLHGGPILRREWWLLAALSVLALLLRLAFLYSAPPGVRFDELVNIKIAERLYAGERPIYFQEAWGHEPLYHYLHAAGMLLLGRTVLGLRIVSILFGVLGTLSAYLIFRSLFGPGTALVAAALLTTSFWSLLYSRFADRHISLPMWIGLAAYCYWRGLYAPAGRRARSTLWFALGGLCMGAMLYTYFASRVVPVLFAAFTIYLALLHRHLLRGRWLGLGAFFVLPLLMVIPMAAYLHQHPELEQRLGQVGAQLLASLRAADLRPLLSTVLNTLKMFSVQGDPEWLYNISGRPVFEPLTAALFYAGTLISLWRWRDPRYAFVLLWLAVGLTPTMLSWPAGSLGHSIAAQPVTFVFPALALSSLWRWASGVASGRSGGKRWIRVACWGFTALALLLFAVQNEYDYYRRWPQSPEVRSEYQAPITAVSRYLQTRATAETAPQDEPQSVCVSAPYVDYWNPWSKMAFDLAFHDSNVQVRWFNGTQSLLLPANSETLVFLPDHILLPSQLDDDLRSLLMEGSRPMEIDFRDRNGSTFDLYRWDNPASLLRRLQTVSSARVWSSPEEAYLPGASEHQRTELSLPLDFGHRLTLLGYAYDRDQVARGESWQLTTYWRVTAPEREALAIFVHLLDDAGVVCSGWDGLSASVASWQVDDVLIQKHTLTLAADATAGTLRAELGAYSPVTLQRLGPFTGEGDETAPHDRVLLQPLRVR
jgi:4-amino-4-deoxy-L-arabinose transferase-like glycosyltransferase